MRIRCPHCGERGNEEFAYFGDATVRRPDRIDPEAFESWMEYVYLRENPAGLHRELWQHVHGCRAWIVVTRDVRNHVIMAVENVRASAAKGAAVERQ